MVDVNCMFQKRGNFKCCTDISIQCGYLQFDFTQYKKSLIDWVAMCQHDESYCTTVHQESIDVTIAWDFTSEVAKKVKGTHDCTLIWDKFYCEVSTIQIIHQSDKFR